MPPFFSFNRKLRFQLNKNAPQGGALRAKEYGCWRSRAPARVCAKRTLFIHPREPGKIRSAAGHRRGVGLNKIALEGGAVNPRFLPREPLEAAAEGLWRRRIPTGGAAGLAGVDGPFSMGAGPGERGTALRELGLERPVREMFFGRFPKDFQKISVGFHKFVCGFARGFAWERAKGILTASVLCYTVPMYLRHRFQCENRA